MGERREGGCDCVPLRTQEEQGRFLGRGQRVLGWGGGTTCTCLSHLSLLLRQGSQLMAFLARFVGGRPSVGGSVGGGDVRPRTMPWRCCLGLCWVGDAGSSSGMIVEEEEEEGLK